MPIALLLASLTPQVASGVDEPQERVESVSTEVDAVLENDLTDLARTYIQARTARLLAKRDGGPVTPPALPSNRVSPALSARAVEVDKHLSGNRQLLARQRQRWLRSDVALTAGDWKILPDGALVGYFTERTSLYFDRILDPGAPPATKQVVDRVFFFEQVGGVWRIRDQRHANPEAPTPVNDAPAPFARSQSASGPGAEAPDENEYYYGTPDPLPPDEAAEDGAGEPAPVPPDAEAEAADGGAPIGEDPKPGDSGISTASDFGTLAGCNYTYMANFALVYWDNYHQGYRAFSNDCTNFISQALRAGGLGFDYGWYQYSSNWWYNQYNQTYTWAAAENWSRFAPKRTYWLSSVWYTGRADVLLADWDRNGNKSHAMIVTARSSSMIYMTYHTYDTLNKPLSIILRENSNAWYYAART